MRFKSKSKYGFLSNFIERPNILIRGIKVEMQAQHAGTVLGLAWVVIGPFILLTLYAIIYALIFKLRTTGLTLSEYILNMFSGLVLFVFCKVETAYNIPQLLQGMQQDGQSAKEDRINHD